MVIYSEITEPIIKRGKGSTIIFRENEYKIHKRNQFFKRVNASFNVYYCSMYRECGCKVKIRETVDLPHRYYISEIEHKHGVSATRSEKESDNRTPKKRKIARLDLDGETDIVAVVPRVGPLDGGQEVKIFFNVCARNYYESLLNPNFSSVHGCWFGQHIAKHSRAIVVGDDDFFAEMLEKNGIAHDTKFMLMSYSPPSERPMTVHVKIGLTSGTNTSILLTKENAYTYEEKEKTGQIALRIQNIVDDDDIDLDLFGEDDTLAKEFDLESGDIDGEDLSDITDMFWRSVLFYAVAQNKKSVVKRLIEEAGMDIMKRDICGSIPLDVARYFKREELESYLYDIYSKIMSSTSKNPFDQLFSIKIDLCLESGAKDTVFIEFDSLFAFILSHRNTLDTETGIPFLHVVYRLEKILKMMKIERNIRVQMVEFTEFENMWSNHGIVLLRRLLLVHIRRILDNKDVHRFESYDTENFAKFLKEIHPYLFLCSCEHENPAQKIPFLTDYGWNYVHNLVVTIVKSKSVFHICPLSSLEFQASSVTGFVYTTRNPEHLKDLPLPWNRNNGQSSEHVIVPYSESSSSKKCEDPHIEFILLVLSCIKEKEFDMPKQILFETVLLQRLLSIKNRCIEIEDVGTDSLMKKEIDPYEDYIEKEFLNRFFGISLSLLNEKRFDIRLLNFDFVDVRLFHVLCRRCHIGDFQPKPIKDYDLSDLKFQKVKKSIEKVQFVDEQQQQQQQSKEEEESLKEEEVEGENDDDSESDDEFTNMMMEDDLLSPNIEEEDVVVNEIKEDSKDESDELWKIDHGVIKTISSINGTRELTEKEKKESEYEREVFKEKSHWRVCVTLDDPPDHIKSRWVRNEGRLIASYRENVDRTTINFRHSLPKLEGKTNNEQKKKKKKKKTKEEVKTEKISKNTIHRNRISGLEKSLRKLRSCHESPEKRIEVLTYILTEHDVDVTELLIYWYSRYLLRYEKEIASNEVMKWKFFHTNVMINLLIDIQPLVDGVSKKKEKRLQSEKNKYSQKIVSSRRKLKEEVTKSISIRKKTSGGSLPSEWVKEKYHRSDDESKEETNDGLIEMFSVEYQMENREKYESIDDFKARTILQDYLDHENFTKFKKNFGFIPDPWQLRLMKCIDEERRALVVTPTSSGKTFLSLYAMGRILEKKECLVFVAPTNSLVNQVATDVVKHFMGDQKMKNELPEFYANRKKNGKKRKLLGVFTSDEKLGPVESHILVTNPECLHILFLSTDKKHMEWKRNLKYIIFDEIHTINDVGKGAVLERLILMAPCPFIALSATIGNSKQLEKWMNAIETKTPSKIERIYNEDRPNDLKYRVFGAKDGNDYVLHPVGLLDEFARDIEKTKENIQVLKRLTPYQSLQLYRCMKDQIGDGNELISIHDVDPNIYFGKKEWKMIPRIIGETKEEETEGEDEDCEGQQQEMKCLNNYEKELKKKLGKILDSENGKQIFSEIVKNCRGDLFDHTENEKSLKKVVPRLVVRMDEKKLFPALFFHLSRAGVVRLGKGLERLISAKQEVDRIRESLEKMDTKNNDDPYNLIETLKKGMTWSKLQMLREDMEEAKEELMKEMERADVDEEFVNRLVDCDFVKESKSRIEEEIGRIKRNRRVARGYRARKRHQQYGQEDTGEDEEEEEEEDSLLSCLRHSIGIHHGAIDKSYRAGVERLFRRGLLKILFCTGTLSYGINAPCKSVVLLGDSPYLTPTLFNQCSGRSGRRGFDTIGNVLIYGIRRERLRRLIVHDSDKIMGNTLINPSYVMRLMISMHHDTIEESQKKERRNMKKRREEVLSMIRQLMSLPLTCIENLDDNVFKERSKKTIAHHFRFSLEFLREISLLDEDGNGIFLAGLASHLFHTEPSNFLLVYFLRRTTMHTMKKEGEKEKVTMRRIMNVLCHLFTDVEIRKSRKTTEMMPLSLPPLDKEIMDDVRSYYTLVDRVFKRYLRNMKKEEQQKTRNEVKDDDILLPFSEVKIGGSYMGEKGVDLLQRFEKLVDDGSLKINDLSIFNIFEGLSGNSEEKLNEMKISDILDCLDVFFDQSCFPIPSAMLEEDREVSSFVYRFYNESIEMKDLAKQHGMIPQIVDWNMGLFRKKLQKVKTSLRQMDKDRKDDFVRMIEEIEKRFNDKFFKNYGSNRRRRKWKWRSRIGNKRERESVLKNDRKRAGLTKKSIGNKTKSRDKFEE